MCMFIHLLVLDSGLLPPRFYHPTTPTTPVLRLLVPNKNVAGTTVTRLLELSFTPR